MLHGRPYAGCTIFGPCNIDANVEVVNTQSNRMCVLRVYNDLSSLLFVNVYMPCESSEVACDEFCTVLAQVKSIVFLARV